MASKQAIDSVGRKNNYMVKPESLYIETREGFPYYDERVTLPLMEKTVRDIMVFGVELPVKIVKAEIEDFGLQVVVIDGRQRVRHAVEANFRLVEAGEEPMAIEASYVGDNDEDNSFVRSVRLNEHRQDDDMMARARKVYNFVVTRGKSINEAAQTFNKSTQAIANYIALVECAPSVQQAVIKGQIPPSGAIKLAKLNLVEQRVALGELIEKNKGKSITVQQAKDAVAERQGKAPTREDFIARARKAMQLLTPDERVVLNAEFDQPEMFEN